LDSTQDITPNTNVLLSKKGFDAAHDDLGLATMKPILFQFSDDLVGVEVVISDNTAFGH
jgi:hypothetical protein